MYKGRRGRHRNHAKGQNTGRWNKNKMISVDGYVKIRVGLSHPLADPNGYCFEHKLVLISAGMYIKKGNVTHHLNGDKSDNRVENLQVIPRSIHNAIHNLNNPRDLKGRFVGKKVAERGINEPARGGIETLGRLT